MPRLYHMPRSRSTRVLWMLTEIGAPYDVTLLAREDLKSTEHVARHPLGRVPALELDDGTVIFESAAICLQLADLYPDAGLIPPLGSPARGLAYQWTVFAMSELESPLFRWIFELSGEPGDSPSQQRFAAAAGAVEGALKGHDWLVEDRFSVADVMCASVLGSAHTRGLLGEWPGVQAYVERAQARPAFIAASATPDQPPE